MCVAGVTSWRIIPCWLQHLLYSFMTKWENVLKLKSLICRPPRCLNRCWMWLSKRGFFQKPLLFYQLAQTYSGPNCRESVSQQTEPLVQLQSAATATVRFPCLREQWMRASSAQCLSASGPHGGPALPVSQQSRAREGVASAHRGT